MKDKCLSCTSLKTMYNPAYASCAVCKWQFGETGLKDNYSPFKGTMLFDIWINERHGVYDRDVLKHVFHD